MFAQTHRVNYFIHLSIYRREKVGKMSKLSSSSTSDCASISAVTHHSTADGVVEQSEVRGASRRDPDLLRPAVARRSRHRRSHELHAGWEVRTPPRPRALRRPRVSRTAHAASSVALAVCAPPPLACPRAAAARPHRQGSGAAPPGAGVRGRSPACCCCSAMSPECRGQGPLACVLLLPVCYRKACYLVIWTYS